MTSPLFVDLYAGDLGGEPSWSVLAELGAPWHGAIIKATEGLHYAPAWFPKNWRAIRDAGGERYGDTWFRGAYHFLKFNEGGAEQADFYLACIEEAGGFALGDLWPVVDVELGSEKNANQLATSQQIVDCTSAFAERVKNRTGRRVVLYGNGAMRDRGITEKMGCDLLWCARYTATLPPVIYQRAGWTTEELLMWQYSGDGVASLAGYPKSPPGFGKCDVSALTLRGGLPWLKANLWSEKPA